MDTTEQINKKMGLIKLLFLKHNINVLHLLNWQELM